MLSTVEAIAMCSKQLAGIKGLNVGGVEEGFLFYFRQEVLRRRRARQHHSLLP